MYFVVAKCVIFSRCTPLSAISHHSNGIDYILATFATIVVILEWNTRIRIQFSKKAWHLILLGYRDNIRCNLLLQSGNVG